jgi:hypothetical protein
MAEYDASAYGDRIADVYDDWPALPANAEAVAERLAALAGRVCRSETSAARPS